MKTIFVIICAFISLLSIGQSVPNGYLLYFPLNGDAKEMSANKLDGHVVGSVNPAADVWGNPCGAMQFSNGGYISVPNSPILQQITSQITVSAWAKLDTNADNFWFSLLCKGENNESSNSPHFRFQFTKLTFALTNRVPTWQIDYNKDEWYHWAVTFDGNLVNVYQNGINVGTLDYSGERLNSNNFALEIGRDITGASEFFTGSIDEIYIYSRSLNPAEIRSIYNYKPRVNCGGMPVLTDCDFPTHVENMQILWITEPIVVNAPQLRIFAIAATQESMRKQFEMSLNGNSWRSGYLPSKRVSVFDDLLSDRCNYLIIRGSTNESVVFRADLEGTPLFLGNEECSDTRYIGIKIIYETQ